MRFILEKEVLKLSCKSFSSEKLLELKKNVACQEALLMQQGMEKEFHRLDTEFHNLIFEGNRKENVWAAIRRLSTHYSRMRVLSEIENQFTQAITQHKKMIVILENKEVNQVENILREHIIEPIKSWKYLHNIDSPYINYFDFT